MIKFYETVEKFIDWVCHKFSIGESKELIKDFQEETHKHCYSKVKSCIFIVIKIISKFLSLVFHKFNLSNTLF